MCPGIGTVAQKKFITPVARKSYGDFFSGEPGHQHGWNSRSVGKWLIKVSDILIHDFDSFAFAENVALMLGIQVFCHTVSILALIKFVFLEPNRESLKPR